MDDDVTGRLAARGGPLGDVVAAVGEVRGDRLTGGVEQVDHPVQGGVATARGDDEAQVERLATLGQLRLDDLVDVRALEIEIARIG